MFSGRNVTWPQDDADVQKLCAKVKEASACFNDCMYAQYPKDKQLIDGISNSLERHHADTCYSPAGRKAFLDRVVCYSNTTVITEIGAEFSRFTNLYDVVLDLARTEQQLSMCCALVYFRDAIRHTYHAHCKPEVVEILEKLVLPIVSFLTKLLSLHNLRCDHYCFPTVCQDLQPGMR